MKEHGVGKRKSSYTFEQLEQVFGQGGWDAQPCQPVLINSSGLYQELESDGSTLEEYSQEDWGNHSQDLHGYPTEQELGKEADVSATHLCLCVYILLYVHQDCYCPYCQHKARSPFIWGSLGGLDVALNYQLVLGVGHLLIWVPTNILSPQENSSF